ncbi:MAG: hypothetical protein RIT02_3521, partial [Planctomycetota bacterium]
WSACEHFFSRRENSGGKTRSSATIQNADPQSNSKPNCSHPRRANSQGPGCSCQPSPLNGLKPPTGRRDRPGKSDAVDKSRSPGFSPGTNISSSLKSPVFFRGWGQPRMMPRTKTAAWALARATYAPQHPKNTAFFHQRKSVSHSHSTFVPRVRNDARDKSWLGPSNRLQFIEKHRVFAVRGRAGMLGLPFCPRRHECSGYLFVLGVKSDEAKTATTP